MWLRWVCGLSLRAAISSIIRWRSGLMVLVSLMGSSFLSEVCDTSILRAGLSTHYWGPLSWLRASRLLHPRSGLERSDFVRWPRPTVVPSGQHGSNPGISCLLHAAGGVSGLVFSPCGAHRAGRRALSQRLPPIRCLRLLLTAKPARARLLQVDLVVVELTGHVIDAHAVAADIAFDLAPGRRRLGGRSQREQHRPYLDRHRLRPKDDGLLIPVPPVPRRNERAAPDAALLFPRAILLADVRIGGAPECERPSLADHPRIQADILDQALG